MPQIYIMAVITLAVSLALWGGLTYLFTGHQKQYFWLVLLGLPQARLPISSLNHKRSIRGRPRGSSSTWPGLAAPLWFLAFKVLITPLIEEAIKNYAVALGPAWKMVTSRARPLGGLHARVSFGLGEAVFIAYAVAQNDVYDSLPWYAFTGFLNERIMACFLCMRTDGHSGDRISAGRPESLLAISLRLVYTFF